MGDSLKKGTGGSKRLVSVRTIDSFFIKKSKSEIEEILDPSLSSTTSSESPNQNVLDPSISSTTSSESPNQNEQSVCATDFASSSVSLKDGIKQAESHFASDIGHYIGKVDIDDFTKAMLLERHWTPPPNYSFPYCVVNKKGKERKKYAQRSHLEKFHWLVLSHKDQGLYCKYCALFIKSSSGGYQKNTPLRRLVKEPLKAFDDLLGEKGALALHQQHQYHKWAIEAGKNFLLTYHQPALNVVNQISTKREQEIKENRERLRPIISTIIFCGRQNIPLRGHRDDGAMYKHKTNTCVQEAETSVCNVDGNFKALLRFRVESGDSNLRHHLDTHSSNATYISKTTQNQLIDICKEEIQDIILSRVNQANFFSIIFDETTDISHTEQLSLTFRYLYNGTLREDFITFCNAYDMIRPEDTCGELRLTGAALAHIVHDLCMKFNVDLKRCVGIGTDSCSVMVSETKGAVQELLKTASNAKRCPCSNHILNNSLSKSSKIALCRNTSATMKKVVSFAKASAKRFMKFQEYLGKSTLQNLCDTRWVERHDGHLQFRGDTLIKICDALEEISLWEDSKTSGDAQCLHHALRSSEFIVSTISICDILGTTVSLSRFLQNSSLDLKRATDAIDDTINVLDEKRQNADSVFKELFLEAQELAKKLDVELKTPRTLFRQANNQQQTTEDHFRRALYIPMLDYIISDLKERYSPDVMKLFNLRILLPRTTYTKDDLQAVREVASTHEQLLGLQGHVSIIQEEFRLWIAKWKRHVETGEEIPTSLVHIIDLCDVDLYPNINALLQVLVTLPVSVATAERTFSTLRRLKTWLRASMGQERLTGLALMNIHQDIELDIDTIITRYAKSCNRRLQFVL